MNGETEPSNWQWAIGIVVVVFGMLFGALERAVSGLRRNVSTDNAAVWQALDDVRSNAAAGREKAAETYASRHDVEQLRAHFDDRMGVHEKRMRDTMRDLLSNRPPVRMPGATE